MSSSEIGLIGFGSSRYDRQPAMSEFAYMWEAACAALDSANLSKDVVDGLAISSTTLRGDNAVTASEHLGLSLRWAGGSVAGGAGSLACVADAIAAVEGGRADYVLCIAGGRQDRNFFRNRVGAFNDAVSLLLAPHGIGGMNGLFGMIQRKHADSYGTRREQLGRIAIGQRASASRNENALLRQDMTIDDYLNAPVIADPLGLYDCVMPCSGAEAVLVGPLESVPKERRVRVLASGERYNHPRNEPVPVRGGWELLRDALYDKAGWGPEDVQFAQCYDDYPIMVAIQLEDLGFCAKGEIGQFLQDRDMHFDGSFPVNTGGGQLSCGQCGGGGGMIGLVEAVRQLRHEAVGRQVPHARRGIVSGYGMVGYGHGLAASAMFLEAGNA